MVKLCQEISIMAFEVYRKINQVIFTWELLATENARSISKHMLLLKIFLYSRINVEWTWMIVGRTDRLQALHDEQRKNHKTR